LSQPAVVGPPEESALEIAAPELPIIEAAGERLRAPAAASVAGLVFALLFSAALVTARQWPDTTSPSDVEAFFASGRDLPLTVGSLYLAPFAGVMFLWFIAVIRDQIGDREDKFFGTVFFGSGLLFTALLFAAAAVAGAPGVGLRYLGLPTPTGQGLDASRALSYTILFVFATRAAAVCVMSIATLGARSRTFPRWFALTGYALAITLLLFVSFWDLYLLALPLWVSAVSLFIFRRERGRFRLPRRESAAS
jgi:hypothetical protein